MAAVRLAYRRPEGVQDGRGLAAGDDAGFADPCGQSSGAPLSYDYTWFRASLTAAGSGSLSEMGAHQGAHRSRGLRAARAMS